MTFKLGPKCRLHNLQTKGHSTLKNVFIFFWIKFIGNDKMNTKKIETIPTENGAREETNRFEKLTAELFL